MAEEKYRVNYAITADQVRLIDQNGNALGIVSFKDAMYKAKSAGLDLVEIAAQAAPPVCKIIDYGKLKYELQKKRSETKKKQKVISVKELKLTPSIGEHDYNVKLNSAKKFIADGNKVKFTLKFRGRELSHQEIGVNLLNRIISDLKDVAKNDASPQLEGRQMIIILTPLAAQVLKKDE